jgi:hypothetical protein
MERFLLKSKLLILDIYFQLENMYKIKTQDLVNFVQKNSSISLRMEFNQDARYVHIYSQLEDKS